MAEITIGYKEVAEYIKRLQASPNNPVILARIISDIHYTGYFAGIEAANERHRILHCGLTQADIKLAIKRFIEEEK